MIFGISGRIAAGKTTFARALERAGCAYARISLVIDAELRARGLTPTRVLQQRIGYELHQERGQRWLCEQAIANLSGDDPMVVDGLRWPDDTAFFRERFGRAFVHVHLEADKDLRAERYSRGLSEEVTFEEADAQIVESEIDGLSRIADVQIVNNGPLRDLEDQAKALLGAHTFSREGTCQQPS
jgi:dephospho-CoA kinase